MNVIPIPANDVAAWWERLEEWIDAACLRTGRAESVESLRAQVENGDGYLLARLEQDGETVGAVIFQRHGDFLHVVSCGGIGVLRALPVLVPQWAGIGAFVACRGLSLRGRKGWDRALRAFGFERNGEYLEASWA